MLPIKYLQPQEKAEILFGAICIMHLSLSKRGVLMQHASYDCEYFSATEWKTIDGVGFLGVAEFSMDSVRH